MRTQIPRFVVLVIGLLMVVDYFVQVPLLDDAAATFRAWGVIVSTFAVGVGATNLLVVHSRKLQAANRDKWQSALLLAIMAVAAVVGVVTGPQSNLSNFIYNSIIEPVDQAMFSLLALFLGSAAYRAFRVRNVEATILLVAAALVMIGQAPATQATAPALTWPSSWIMNVINVAGQRGIIIGSGIAFVGLSLRIILGLERRFLGEAES